MKQVLIVFVIGLLIAPAYAQGEVLSEQAYWQQLQTTQAALKEAVLASGAARADILQQVSEQWQSIQGVQIDDTVININTRWLQIHPQSDAATIQRVVNRITALQSYASKQGISLNGLDFEEELPPPQRDINFEIPAWVATLFRIAVIVIGVVGIAGIIGMIVHGIRVSSVTATASNGEDNNDPQTSDDARERASSSEQVKDYRAAVRYLYLSSLLMLDESGLIRYDPTLTNQEHLSQIEDRPNLKTILQPIINFFDRTWYGFADITEADYQRFRSQVDQLQRLASERRA